VDWWVEHGDNGTRFCFEEAEAKKAFASICENLAIPCMEADHADAEPTGGL
jgi:hypothetical protein